MGRWILAMVLPGALALLAAQPADAGTGTCVSDAELEAAVGDQLRAGAFAINTAKLGERQMCSQVSLARAIQQLREKYFPPPPPPAPVRTDPPASATPVARAAPASPGHASPRAAPSPAAALAGYVGKYSTDKVGGYAFLDHPAVVSALKRAGVPASVRKEMRIDGVNSPMSRVGDVLEQGGCRPHACDSNHYRIYIHLRTGAAAVCLAGTMDAPSGWWSTALPGRPLPLAGDCLGGYRGAPAAIRTALEAGVAPPARLSGPAGAGSLPDITAALRYEDASYCSSNAISSFFGTADEKGEAPLGPLGRVKVLRSGPDKDGYITLSARVAARWNGLTVTELSHTYLPDTDSSSTDIVFREPPAVAGPVLSRLGFGVRKAGDSINRGSSTAMDMVVSLAAERGGARLSCGT